MLFGLARGNDVKLSVDSPRRLEATLSVFGEAKATLDGKDVVIKRISADDLIIDRLAANDSVHTPR
jgi:hypothetical protein